MYTKEELLKSRQTQCQWKTEGYCSITEFDKCKTCKAIHTKPLGLNGLMIDGWEGIKAKQRGENNKDEVLK